MAQRFIIQLDEKGKLSKGVGHTIPGAGPPFQSFESTYTLKGQGK